jgi:hypothetical protein
MRRAIWLFALAAFGCGEARQADAGRLAAADELPHNLAGCYALYDADGRPASQSLHYASDKVRLDTAAHPVRPDAWSVTRLGGDGGMPGDGRGSRSVYWAVDSLTADTIRVMIHTGRSGSELILGVGPAAPDTLHGRALEHWDLGPSTDDAGRVMAVRVSCGWG